ncbi:MAG: hypothetical protein VX210_10980 [Myxococcota bacterium]|nr:hypothetical protein [Myxococcota bacterium]
MAKKQKSSKMGMGIMAGGVVVIIIAVFLGPKLDRPKAKPRPNVYEGVTLQERRLQVMALDALRPKVRSCYREYAQQNEFLEGIIVVSFVAEWFDAQAMFPEVRLEAPRAINTKSLEDRVELATRRLDKAKTPRLSDEEKLADAEAQLKEATDANGLVEKLDACLKKRTKKLIFEVEEDRPDGELALVFPFAFSIE